MRKLFIASLVAVLPSLAMAQAQPQPEQPSTAVTSVSLALQLVGTSARQLIEDMQRQMAAKDAQIAELQKQLDASKAEAKAKVEVPNKAEAPTSNFNGPNKDLHLSPNPPGPEAPK